MTYNWRIGTNRGPNHVNANPQRIGTPKDARWATGRNVKGDRTRGPYGVTYEIVEVWTLKRRDLVTGKVLVVEDGRSREYAEAWVKEGSA
jgi:hypothetical protein